MVLELVFEADDKMMFWATNIKVTSYKYLPCWCGFIQNYRTKYEFLKAQIMEVEQDLKQLDAIKTTLPGAISYVLFGFLYSIDYLIKPKEN